MSNNPWSSAAHGFDDRQEAMKMQHRARMAQEMVLGKSASAIRDSFLLEDHDSGGLGLKGKSRITMHTLAKNLIFESIDEDHDGLMEITELQAWMEKFGVYE